MARTDLFSDAFTRTTLGGDWTEVVYGGTGSTTLDGSVLTIQSTGDFWERRDSARLVHRPPIWGDWTIEVTLPSKPTGGGHVRNLMARAHLRPDSAFYCLIYDGDASHITTLWRESDNASATWSGDDTGVAVPAGASIRARLTYTYDTSTVTASVSVNGGAWTALPNPKIIPHLRYPVLVANNGGTNTYDDYTETVSSSGATWDTVTFGSWDALEAEGPWERLPDIDVRLGPSDPVEDSDPVGFWRLDGNALDSAGDYHGTVIGSGASWSTTGPFPGVGALALNGDGASYVEVPARFSDVAAGRQGVSAEGWLNLTALPAAGTVPSIISEQHPTGNDVVLTLAVRETGAVYFGIYDGANGGWHETPGVAAALGVDQHWAGTYDGVTLRLYRNGVEVSTTAWTGSVPPGGGGVWRLGCRWDAIHTINGRIARVGVFPRALTADEVARHAKRPAALRFALDDLSGATVMREAVSGRHGTFINGPLQGYAGARPGGKAVLFTGTSYARHDHPKDRIRRAYQARATDVASDQLGSRLRARGYAVTQGALNYVPTLAELQAGGYDLFVVDGYAWGTNSWLARAYEAYQAGISVITSGNDTTAVAGNPIWTGATAATAGIGNPVSPSGSHPVANFTAYNDGDAAIGLTGVRASAVICATFTDGSAAIIAEQNSNGARYVHHQPIGSNASYNAAIDWTERLGREGGSIAFSLDASTLRAAADTTVQGVWQNNDNSDQNHAGQVSIFRWASDNFYCRVSDASGTLRDIAPVASTTFSEQRYYRVVYTWRDGRTALYRDGVLLQERVEAFSLAPRPQGAGSRLGYGHQNPGNGIRLDDVVIYDREITAAEVAADYTAATANLSTTSTFGAPAVSTGAAPRPATRTTATGFPAPGVQVGVTLSLATRATSTAIGAVTMSTGATATGSQATATAFGAPAISTGAAPRPNTLATGSDNLTWSARWYPGGGAGGINEAQQRLAHDVVAMLNFTNRDPQQVDNFHVVARGVVRPRFTETYTFVITGDDHIRMYVDDVLLPVSLTDGGAVVDSWKDQGPTSYFGRISLEARRLYSIRFENAETGGGHTGQMEWYSPSQAREFVTAVSPVGMSTGWVAYPGTLGTASAFPAAPVSTGSTPTPPVFATASAFGVAAVSTGASPTPSTFATATTAGTVGVSTSSAATPPALATSTTVGVSVLSAGATATPTSLATTTALAPVVMSTGTAPTPSTLATGGGVQSLPPSTGSQANPGLTPTSAAFPAPGLLLTATATPTALDTATALDAPTVYVQTRTIPAALDTTAGIGALVPSTGTAPTPAALDTTSAVVDPAVSSAADVPAHLTTSGFGSPALLTGSTVTPTAHPSTSAIAAPALSTGAAPTPSTLGTAAAFPAVGLATDWTQPVATLSTASVTPNVPGSVGVAAPTATLTTSAVLNDPLVGIILPTFPPTVETAAAFPDPVLRMHHTQPVATHPTYAFITVPTDIQRGATPTPETLSTAAAFGQTSFVADAYGVAATHGTATTVDGPGLSTGATPTPTTLGSAAAFGAPLITIHSYVDVGTVTTTAIVGVPVLFTESRYLVAAIATVSGFGPPTVEITTPSIVDLKGRYAPAIDLAATIAADVALRAVYDPTIDLQVRTEHYAPSPA